MYYQIPGENGKLLHVCKKKTFCNTFALSDKRVHNLVLWEQNEEYICKEKKGVSNTKFTKQTVIEHIKSIHAEENHGQSCEVLCSF